jgi:hypothetical protein
MGCDIHIYVEKFDGKEWKSADTWSPDEYDQTRNTNYPQVYEGRNYELFAILAGVRNRYDIEPIVRPRGLPGDISNEVQSEADRWNGDGHSHSWLTLKELQEYDWNKNYVNSGLVDVEGYKEFKEKGKPSSYWQAGGGNHITNQEMDEFVASDKKGGFSDPCTYVEWQESGTESVDDFLTQTIPKLEKIKGEDKPENVRIVFWFDS